MAKCLYLDANIYLSFYHYTSEDLNELNKLFALCTSGELELYLPQQTKDEFIRNRHTKIADALKRFSEKNLENSFPNIVKDFEIEYNLMKIAVQQYNSAKKDILDKIKEDINQKCLSADLVIQELFEKATLIQVTSDLIEKAKTRSELGNPPGKKGSYGDALNWESLLEKADAFDDFFFISEDQDYFSVWDKKLFNEFLLEEWKDKKPITDFYYFTSLSSFFKIHYPNINIETEFRKDDLIRALKESNSFATTRKILLELVSYSDYTKKQISDIVEAAIVNNQIFWIATNEIVHECLWKLVFSNSHELEPDKKENFLKKFSLEVEETEDLPF